MLVAVQSTSLINNRPLPRGVQCFPFYQMANVSGPLHFKSYEKIESFSNEAVAVLSEGKLVNNLACGMKVFSSWEEQHLRNYTEHFLLFVCICPKLDAGPCVKREDRSGCFFTVVA